MEKLDAVLAAHPFFRDLSQQHLQLISGCASNVRFDAGQFIFREGEDANQFYVIRHGKVSLEIFCPGTRGGSHPNPWPWRCC